jgi:predicted ABC-type ATPase
VADASPRPCITVLAGTNGGGKSSIAGAMLRSAGGDYFNPDEAARRIRERDPSLRIAEANGLAWREGKRLLERAIDERKSFAFETTLGGSTMAELLDRAAAAGLEVRVWYVALQSPELHLARVRARVARGGHDIPEADIRRRYTKSLENLVRLLPKLTELRMFDNSAPGDPAAGRTPQPQLVLHVFRGRVVRPMPSRLARTPPWAKPVVAAALKLEGRPIGR